MLAIADGFQISEAVPTSDGGLFTTLVDQDGNEVGTVTRLANGNATASVDDRGGVDWSNVLTKVTTFLDTVASGAKQTSDEVTRINRGIQGAVTGARAGYGAPIDWKPYAIAAGGIVIAIAIGSAMSNRQR